MDNKTVRLTLVDSKDKKGKRVNSARYSLRYSVYHIRT